MAPHTDITSDGSVATIAPDIKTYRDIGLDNEGRSHFYDAEAEEILICAGDRRGRGVRDNDVLKTINASGRSVDEYKEFVRDLDGGGWSEVRGA